MSTWEIFYQRTVDARYRAMLEALNAKRAADGLRALDAQTIDWLAEYGPREFENARVLRECGVLVPPPAVLVNTNDETPYIARFMGAWDELMQEIIAHEDRGLNWWSWRS